jgi:hypothetical protein
VPRDDGSKQRIHRCPTSGVTPDVHIYTKSKLSWVTLPDSVPAFEAYYDSTILWPAASLERVQAALAPGRS